MCTHIAALALRHVMCESPLCKWPHTAAISVDVSWSHIILRKSSRLLLLLSSLPEGLRVARMCETCVLVGILAGTPLTMAPSTSSRHPQSSPLAQALPSGSKYPSSSAAWLWHVRF